MEREEVFLSDRERFSFCFNVAAVIGAGYLLKILVLTLCSLVSWCRAYILAPRGISRVNLLKYGSWAIVTGASEGIGRGYAIELARQGLNVAILSRSEKKLNAVAETIRNQYNREVRVIPVDFTDGQSVYADIQAEISDLDVAVLVNNVGLNLDYPEYFGNVPEDRHRNIIELNCQSMVQMTHLVLPKMIEKGTGVIVNLSSYGSIMPQPLLNVYSATKAFVNYFSTALHYEYQSHGITVQLVQPLQVDTAMTGFLHGLMSGVDPDQYGASAVATIGIQQHTYGCLYHALQALITETITPKWLLRNSTFSFFSRIRHQKIQH